MKLFGAMITLVGFGLFYSALLWFRTPETPRLSFNPRVWFHRSSREDVSWFRGPGFVLYFGGLVLGSLGVLLFGVLPLLRIVF